jgi:hypothetical protein
VIRFSRASKNNTACAATLVSLIALAACGADVGSNNNTEVPPFGGNLPESTTNPINPAGNPNPPGTDEPPAGTDAPGEDNPNGVPLTPPTDIDDGDGDGDGDDDPPTTDPPTTDPPTTDPPTTDPPTTDPPATDPPANPPVFEPPAFVENNGTNCPLPQFPGADALPVIGDLPDPFTKLDGTRMTSRAEWRCRRQEIKELAEQYIYGDKPARPQTVTGTVSNTNITVNVSNQGRNATFNVGVQLPNNGTAPYPALISFGGFAHTDVVRAEGVAVINVTPASIGSEGGSRANKTGAFYTLYGNTSFTGLLAAWSWGISRIIDVIEQSGSNTIDPTALAVTGCSRNGKAAFAIGAFDERIALTIPFESGSGGVPIFRGIPGEGAQSLSSAFGETYWLGDAFGAFINNGQGRLPIDTHEIVAMVAPRGLLVLDNPYIANLGPESAHVAALAGAEVFRALGAGENISYISAINDGTHCSARPEFVEPVRQAVRKFLTKTGNTAGSIRANANATGNLAEWRDWTTPTLN